MVVKVLTWIKSVVSIRSFIGNIACHKNKAILSENEVLLSGDRAFHECGWRAVAAAACGRSQLHYKLKTLIDNRV